MPHDTDPDRRPGRRRGPVGLRPARLVPLTDEHERAALAALAALLAAEHHERAEGGDDE